MAADKTWLEEALEVTTGERRRDYGRPLVNFADIAIAETVQFRKKLRDGFIFTPVDVAVWNNLQKHARHKNTFKRDNFVDVIGYTACIDDMDRQLVELGFETGIVSLDDMSLQDLFDLIARIEREARLPPSTSKP